MTLFRRLCSITALLVVGALLPVLGFGFYAWKRAVPAWAEKTVIAAFHIVYHHRQTFNDTHWLGTEVQKTPLDLWVYQEIIHELRPDLIVETGTYKGGSALFMASICDLENHGQVATVDIEEYPGRPQHGRIRYLLGSSTAPGIIEQFKALAAGQRTVLVSLDSDHAKQHVLNELRLYSGLVTKGSYLIVEDTHFNGHPILPHFGPGPREAVQEFLKENQDFVADRGREKYLLTFNAGGFLRRVR
ncbi:MAG: CmcI family methyltransferase [Bryobacteraceae bacterium]|jgi:cephalosporin hydroxylase